MEAVGLKGIYNHPGAVGRGLDEGLEDLLRFGGVYSL